MLFDNIDFRNTKIHQATEGLYTPSSARHALSLVKNYCVTRSARLCAVPQMEHGLHFALAHEGAVAPFTRQINHVDRDSVSPDYAVQFYSGVPLFF
jgi:hypothetical protein